MAWSDHRALQLRLGPIRRFFNHPPLRRGGGRMAAAERPLTLQEGVSEKPWWGEPASTTPYIYMR